MDLADRGGRERGEIVRRAPTMIGGAHIYIIDIAQDAASGARRHAGKEFPFRDRRLASTLVVEFWADPQCRAAGEFEVVIGADRLRWSCKTFT